MSNEPRRLNWWLAASSSEKKETKNNEQSHSMSIIIKWDLSVFQAGMIYNVQSVVV